MPHGMNNLSMKGPIMENKNTEATEGNIDDTSKGVVTVSTVWIPILALGVAIGMFFSIQLSNSDDENGIHGSDQLRAQGYDPNEVTGVYDGYYEGTYSFIDSDGEYGFGYSSQPIDPRKKYEFGRVNDYLVVQPEHGDELLFQSDEIKGMVCGDPDAVTCFNPERETLILCDPQINGGECSEVASANPKREKLGLSYEPRMSSSASSVIITEVTADGFVTDGVEYWEEEFNK